MNNPDTSLCSCGRTAEWISNRTGLPECWEVIHKDDPMVWKQKYHRDKIERHLKENE